MDAVASRATYLAPFHWREAALCGPAMPILLGEWYGWPAGGAVAAGSAFAVGFGAARELRGRRWAAMVGALAGMTVAAFLGTVLGQHSVIFLVSAALAAAGCAALALPEMNMTCMQPLLPPYADIQRDVIQWLVPAEADVPAIASKRRILVGHCRRQW